MPSRRRNPRQPTHDTDDLPITLPEEEAIPLLASGEVIGGFRMAWGSNYTFLVRLQAGEGKYLQAIYKPRDGERPLYDYPHGTLYQREHATFILSRALGWPNIPYTLVREGPYGIGSMQHYVECDPDITYFDLFEERAEEFLKFALFDVVVNNGDRKAGHCLLGEDGRIWSIDHGLTFHPIFKLRTVMLEYWGKAIPEPLVEDLKILMQRLRLPTDSLTAQLSTMVAKQEIQALMQRVDALIKEPKLPVLDPYHDVPWPWV
ncbi:MAG: SCO1664 family protein [Chloroflexi bacterium]|nr:SCO1664 family protein [Chloroflexota bacterium]MDA1226521.1 SCO1664 family protein [Chloroflexota bacterium]